MKHMRKQLVAFFNTLVPKIDDGFIDEELTIRDLCKHFKNAFPQEECPSDMQISMAANEVFKRCGYKGNARIWTSKLVWMEWENIRLNEENEELKKLLRESKDQLVVEMVG